MSSAARARQSEQAVRHRSSPAIRVADGLQVVTSATLLNAADAAGDPNDATHDNAVHRYICPNPDHTRHHTRPDPMTAGEPPGTYHTGRAPPRPSHPPLRIQRMRLR